MKAAILSLLNLLIITSGCVRNDYNYNSLAADKIRKPDMAWVYIDAPGIDGREGFTGYFSKYETTNAQYARFLNELWNGEDLTIEGNRVREEKTGYSYYYLNGKGLTTDDVINGGASKIRFENDAFTVEAGFENHPVTYVTWFGAAAFCDFYGWKLPNERQWQAVAAYNGAYTYGCGREINDKLANFRKASHIHGTTEVGTFGTFGYGLADMAGNVWELTASSPHPPVNSYHVLKGGGWNDKPEFCEIRLGYYLYPSLIGRPDVGFRLSK
jgi:formylglycine-generating enzyme required for sulfatase activity